MYLSRLKSSKARVAGYRLSYQPDSQGSMIRPFVLVFAVLGAVSGFSCPGFCQMSSELESYFKRDIGLNQGQIDDIHKGKPVAKVMKSRTPADIIVFGAIRINATPESYIEFFKDFDRLRTLPTYLAVGQFSTSPVASDLHGFSFESKDIKELRNCKPADCKIQLPAKSMEAYQKSIDWKAPGIQQRVNQLLQQRTVQRLQAYQSEGNSALITYDDKDEPVDTAKQFESIVSYAQTLTAKLPDFYHYLLAYPAAKPANTQDIFYWSNEKFGLKPTLRVIHVVITQGRSTDEPAYVIAEKQLYASHYFQTALSLTFLLQDAEGKPAGFYLVRAMGATQAGLTGFKGSIIRGKAVKQATAFLRESLQDTRSSLERQGATKRGAGATSVVDRPSSASHAAY